MGYIKDTIKFVKEEPKQALQDVAMCLWAFVVFGMLLFLSAILQGCTATRTVEARGHTTIITTDTTHVGHTGHVSIKLSK